MWCCVGGSHIEESFFPSPPSLFHVAGKQNSKFTVTELRQKVQECQAGGNSHTQYLVGWFGEWVDLAL